MKVSINVESIDALLPQTQCRECGYEGCKPYAEAISQGASIDGCTPGGVDTLHKLAKLLQIDPTPYQSSVESKIKPPSVAFIDENACIGCTKCIFACPVDSIVGSAKLMHTVIENECTGCGLCIPACPTDCIDMLPIKELTYNPLKAKDRYHTKRNREEESNPSTLMTISNRLANTVSMKKDYIEKAKLKKNWDT